MTYSTKILHSVRDCEPAWWDKLSQKAPFTSHRWYLLGETVLPEDRPVYIVVEKDAEPVARATFWVKREDALPISSNLLYRGMNAFFSRWPLMICQSPLSSTGGLILPNGPEREEIFDLIMQPAVHYAQRTRASFLVLDYVTEDEVERLDFHGKLTGVALSEPGTRLVIAWADFDAYLQHLSKNERKSYKRAMRKAGELGVEVRVEEDIEDIEAAVALIQQHDETYDSPTIPWLESLLRHFKMVDSVWLAAYVEGKLVGCELLLGDNGTWVATALGRNYDYPYVYFALGYQSIRSVIERGGKYLRWGTGTYAYKKRLGFELEENDYVSFLAQNRLVNAVFKKVAARIVD